MRLIDPQPMETLPDEGEVFVEWKDADDGSLFTFARDVFTVRFYKEQGAIGTYLAWSYTATTKEPT